MSNRGRHGTRGGVDPQEARRWLRGLALGLSAGLWLGCGPPTLDDRIAAYRQRIEEALDREPAASSPRPSLALPDRRARRLAVGDQRIGPFDFLATIGCPLSELVAERNGPLGRVLEPTRRLAHELRVVGAVEECLPTLSESRAARLRARLEEKRADLGAHVWNAVWLDEEVERFLSSAPRALIGGDDPADGGRQLRRAADALAARDVRALESALAQLRDDPGVGPLFASSWTLARELERVVTMIERVPVERCGRGETRLARIFLDDFVPLQAQLGGFDRRSGEVLEGLGRLFEVSARAARVPEEMASYRRALIGDGERGGLFRRQRSAMRAHAAAWGPILRACGVLPEVDA